MTQYFFPVLYSLLQILILAGIGFVLRRFIKWKQDIFSAVSQLIMKLTLPVMFLTRMASMDRADLVSGAFFPFYTFLVMGGSFLLSLLAFKLFRIPRQSAKVYIALSSFGNVGYIPLALIDIFAVSIAGFKEFFDMPLPSLYVGSYIFTYSPLLWSLGNYLVTGSGGKLRIKQFLTPPVIGILSGVGLCLLGSGPLVADSSLPFHYVHEGLKTLGSITSPLILLVLGSMVGDLKFEKSLSPADLKFALTPMLVRYLALPVLFLLVLKSVPSLMGLTPAVLLVLFMETIVPPPANFSIMTKTAGKNEKETALALLVTYGSYLVVLPVYLMIFFNMIRF